MNRACLPPGDLFRADTVGISLALSDPPWLGPAAVTSYTPSFQAATEQAARNAGRTRHVHHEPAECFRSGPLISVIYTTPAGGSPLLIYSGQREVEQEPRAPQTAAWARSLSTWDRSSACRCDLGGQYRALEGSLMKCCRKNVLCATIRACVIVIQNQSDARQYLQELSKTDSDNMALFLARCCKPLSDCIHQMQVCIVIGVNTPELRGASTPAA